MGTVAKEHGLGRVSMRPHGSEVMSSPCTPRASAREPPRSVSVCQSHTWPAGCSVGVSRDTQDSKIPHTTWTFPLLSDLSQLQAQPVRGGLGGTCASKNVQACGSHGVSPKFKSSWDLRM